MKVLFAVSDDSISNAVITRYQQKYKEIITSKNVYYFNAIIAELQNNKTYDAIVIGEDLEPMANANYDKIDKFLFEKLDNISDEASKIDGEDMSIILICADRRDKSDTLLNKLFSLGIYNALIGRDRSVDDVCLLMKKPRSKKEAKLYYKIVDSVENIEYKNVGLINGVNETEIQNILNHYAKIGNDERKIVSSFDSIARQYDDTELRIIIKILPMNVRAVLEQKSSKYQRLVSNGTVLSNGQYMPFQRPKNNIAQNIEITTVNTGTKPEVTGNVIIPQNIKINRPENVNLQRQQQMQNQRVTDPRMQNPNQYGQIQNQNQNQNQMNQRMNNNQSQQRPMTREEIMKCQEYLRRMQMQQMMMRQQQAQTGMSQQQLQQMQQQVNNIQRPMQRPNMNQNQNMVRPNINIPNNQNINPKKEDDDLKKKYESPIDDEISKSLEIPELEKIEVKDFDKDIRDKKYQDTVNKEEEKIKEDTKKEKEAKKVKEEPKVKNEIENKEKIEDKKEIKETKEAKEVKTDKKDIPKISDEILKLRKEIEKEVNEEENVKKEQIKKKETKKEKEQVKNADEIDEIEAIKRKIQQELEEEKQREQKKKKPVERRIINQSVNKEKEIKKEDKEKQIKEIKENKVEEIKKEKPVEKIIEQEQESNKQEVLNNKIVNKKQQIENEEVNNPINQTININNDFEKELKMEIEPLVVENKADKVVKDESKEQQSQEEKIKSTKDNNETQYDDDLSELLSVSLDDEDREEDLYDNIALYNMDSDENKVDVDNNNEQIKDITIEDQTIDNEEEIYKSLMNDFESYRTKQENVPEGQKITMSIDSNSDTEESLPEDIKTPLINKEVSPYKNANNFGTGVDYGNNPNSNNNNINNSSNSNQVNMNMDNGNIPIHIGNNQVKNNNQIVEENNININDYNNIMSENNNYNDYNNIIENPQHINMNMNNNTNNQQNVYNEIVNNNSEMIAFVGTSKNGTSFIVNNLALMLANNNVRVAILDLTENRNDYYLFTDNNPDLTNVAINSLKSLSEGYTDGLNIGNKFYVYTALPENSMFDDLNVQNIINTARNNYDIILLDCDFKTDDEYFKNADQICLIQTMDAFTIQPLTHFLHKKIEKNVIDSNKLKIVVNKYLKLKKLNERLIVEGLSKYNEPSMTLQKTLFDSQNIAYTVVPFEMQTYAKYLEAIVMCQVDLRGYSQYFLSSMEEVRDMLFEENKVRKTRKLGKMFR